MQLRSSRHRLRTFFLLPLLSIFNKIVDILFIIYLFRYKLSPYFLIQEPEQPEWYFTFFANFNPVGGYVANSICRFGMLTTNVEMIQIVHFKIITINRVYFVFVANLIVKKGLPDRGIVVIIGGYSVEYIGVLQVNL